MIKTRSKAAHTIKISTDKLRDQNFCSAEIDSVLDFFKDLGFYVKGSQISPEVAHHAFHAWIRGYYCAAREYMETAQEREPTQWEFVAYLFEETHSIEIERGKGRHKRHLDKIALNAFLEQEIALCPPN